VAGGLRSLEELDEPVACGQDGRWLAGDEAAAEDTERAGFRTYGKSEDSRDDLPQIVIGMAVTRDGIPVRSDAGPGTPRTRR
jgi:transposase